MANIDENFVVKTGLTVGSTTITASTGNVQVGGTIINGTTGNIVVGSTSRITVGSTIIDGVTGTVSMGGNVIISSGGDVTGNSATTTKLATARTISVTGDATGSASFDGSANAAIATTLANSGVTAGVYTKLTVNAKGLVTVGGSLASSDVTTALGFTPYNATNPSNYVASGAAASFSTVSATTFTGALTGNVTGNVSGSAGTAGTVTTAAQPNITSVGTLTSLAVTNGITAKDVTISGNLVISGSQTTINSTQLAVDDLNITVAAGAGSAAAANGAGLTVAGANATLIYGNANDNFTFNKRVDATSFYGSGVGLTSVPNSALVGSGSLTVGSTNIALGGTASTLAGLTSVTATTFIGALNGNAGTATSATTATHVAGGVAGAILYQSAAATTAMTAAGTTSQVLVGGTSPAWSNTPTLTGTNFTGVPVAGITGLANSATIASTALNTINTIVSRDGSGGFAAGVITATSTNARYADLAENYSADAEYVPGTVLDFGGDAEVTLGSDGSRKVAGVVTTNPAYLMNNDLAGVKAAVALQGRVPCKVKGKVSKGDMMVSAGGGYARAEADPKMGQVIGKALQNFDGAEGVVEVVVGRM